MDNHKQVLEKLKALRNYSLDSDDPQVQAIGHMLNTIYLSERNSDTLELMKVLAGFMITKNSQKDNNDGDE